MDVINVLYMAINWTLGDNDTNNKLLIIFMFIIFKI